MAHRKSVLVHMTIEIPREIQLGVQNVAAATDTTPQEVIVELLRAGLRAARIPNAKTRKAIDDANKGKNVKSFKTLQELLDDLND